MNDWQPVFDPQSQEYYYWNTRTNETSWENPFTIKTGEDVVAEEVAETTQTEVTETAEIVETDNTQHAQNEEVNPEDYYKNYAHHFAGSSSSNSDYVVKGFFNARTGKFESRPDEKNPDSHSTHAKSSRQMYHYFDYSAWAEERGQKYENAEEEEKKKPTKKEMDKYRQKQKERQKKKRAWLFE